MIKAIIFDCFGVLVTESWESTKRYYFSDDRDKLQQASDLMHQADSGSITHEHFIERIASLANAKPADVQNRLNQIQANTELFEYISSSLNGKYKIGMLSNVAANWLDRLFTKSQLALIDAMNLSFETGLMKPSKEAYEYMASHLDANPSECIFIDDNLRQAEGAEAAGMSAIVYENFGQMKAELERLLTTNAEG